MASMQHSISLSKMVEEIYKATHQSSTQSPCRTLAWTKKRNPLLMFTSKPRSKQARMTLTTMESFLKTIKERPQKGDS